MINFFADAKLIIPEYKIELLNKSKKVIKVIESIDKSNEIKDSSINERKLNKTKTAVVKLEQAKTKKTKFSKKKAKTLRTLWVRKKKRA